MTSHKTVTKAAAYMMVAILASRVLGLVRDMLIASRFGQGGVTSAYTAAFNLPDLLYFFLSSGALSSAFIPEFTKRFQAGKQKEAWQIFSIIACFMGVVLTIAVVLAWIYAKPLAGLLAVPGFVERHPELVPLTVQLTRIILPCQLFFFAGGLMMASLESRQKFSARAMGPVIYNIGIIFGAVVLSKWFHIAGLAIGTLIGAFAGNIVYTLHCLRKEGVEFHPSLNIRHPGVVRVARLALPVIFGLTLPQIDIIVNKWFASFVSDSAPAALNFANRLMQMPLGIFAQAAGTAILPTLSVYAAKNALGDMRSVLSYGLRAVMVESMPATLFMIVMADPLVRTIYMSGGFKPSSVPVTAIPLVFYSIGIFAWAGQAIVARGFFAMQDTLSPVLLGTVATIIFLPLNYILMRAMGSGGIALATTIAITLHFVLLTVFLRKRLNGLEGMRTLKTVAKALAAACVMAVVCIGVRYGMARVVGSWQLQDGDVRNPAALAEMLKQGGTPLDAYLYSKLTDKTRRLISDQEEVEGASGSLRGRLASELNRWIESPAVPADVTPAEYGGSLTAAKRAYLEETYAGAIARRAKPRTWVEKLLTSGQAQPTRVGRVGESLLLSDSDILDVSSLATALTDPYNPASSDLLKLFSEDTRTALARYVSLHQSASEMPLSLMHDVNREVKDSSLPGVQGHPTGKSLAKANRRLLEAAYPGHIARRPLDRVESRMGSLLTVLLAMALGGVVYLALLRMLKVDEMDYVWSVLRRKFLGRGTGRAKAEDETVVDDVVEPLD